MGAQQPELSQTKSQNSQTDAAVLRARPVSQAGVSRPLSPGDPGERVFHDAYSFLDGNDLVALQIG